MGIDVVDLFSLRFGRARGATPPLGALSLQAAAAASGLSCRVIDTQLDASVHPFAVGRLVEMIDRSDASALAFSVFNDAIPLLVSALGRMSRPYARPIIVGGPGVVGIAALLLERAPAITAVVVGEGETAFPLILQDLEHAARLSGIFTRDRNGCLRGAGRTPREHLDELPPVDWRLARGRYTAIPWSTMRGCPFACQFCEIIAFIGRQVTMRSIPLAIADLLRAKESLGVRRVHILDDTFTISKTRVLALCAALQAADLDIEFEIFSRTNTLDEGTMDALADAGCVRVFFGLDGGDDDLLAQVTKGIRIAEAERTLYAAAERFDVTASFIWGYPFETLGAFEHMMALAQRLLNHQGCHEIWPQLHLLSPSAGTPLFDRYGKTLFLDDCVELFPVGTTLKSHKFRDDFKQVTDVIRSDAILAAPFHRYPTPDFDIKLSRVEAFNRSLDRAVGVKIVQRLTAMEAQC